MKQKTLFLLLFIIIISCKPKESKPVEFSTNPIPDRSSSLSLKDSMINLVTSIGDLYVFNEYDEKILNIGIQNSYKTNGKEISTSIEELTCISSSLVLDSINNRIHYKIKDKYLVNCQFIDAPGLNPFIKLCFLQVNGIAPFEHEKYFKVFLINSNYWWNEVTNSVFPMSQLANYYGITYLQHLSEYFEVSVVTNTSLNLYINNELKAKSLVQLVKLDGYDSPNRSFLIIDQVTIQDTLLLKWNSKTSNFFIAQ